MTQSVEQIVEEYRKATKQFRRQMQDPAKARAFLLRAGIAEKTRKSKAHPHGIRLAKQLRSA